MSEDVSKMSNQERINPLGVEEANKYLGPHKRRNDQVEYWPAVTEVGGQFYLAQLALKDEASKRGEDYKIKPTPRECVIPTYSFKRKKPNVETKSPFKLSDIRSKKRSRKRANTA